MPFDSAKCLGMHVNVHFSLDRLVRKKGQLWGEVEKRCGGGGGGGGRGGSNSD